MKLCAISQLAEFPNVQGNRVQLQPSNNLTDLIQMTSIAGMFLKLFSLPKTLHIRDRQQ